MNIIGRTHRRRRRALTLIECMLALTMLPLAVASVAYAIVAGQSQAAEARSRMHATMLAESLMEEILSLPHDPDSDNNLGPEPGETDRSQFNSPNDFDGYVEAAGTLSDATGTACPQATQTFSRFVECRNESLAVSGLGPAMDGLLITVTVNRNDRPIVLLTRFIVDPQD